MSGTEFKRCLVKVSCGSGDFLFFLNIKYFVEGNPCSILCENCGLETSSMFYAFSILHLRHALIMAKGEAILSMHGHVIQKYNTIDIRLLQPPKTR